MLAPLRLTAHDRLVAVVRGGQFPPLEAGEFGSWALENGASSAVVRSSFGGLQRESGQFRANSEEILGYFRLTIADGLS